MPTPTDGQLREYAEKLPDVYQYILKTFPLLNRDRRFGDGLTETSLVDAFAEAPYHPDEVPDALDQLVAKGFLEQSPNFRFFSPTPLGERLIEIITGYKARVKGAPPLPEPTWG